MITEICIDKSERDVPYIELLIGMDDEPYEITFRAYTRNVWVGIEDNRANPSGGLDLEDCYIVSANIIQRTPKAIFDPKEAFLNAMRYSKYLVEDDTVDIGDYVPNYQKELVLEWYEEILPKVEEWMKMIGRS